MAEAPSLDVRDAALAGYHHPHFLDGKEIRTWGGGSWNFSFREFTGREDEPSPPGDLWRTALTEEQKDFLYAEYRAARIVWSKTRFCAAAVPALRAAAPVWQNYARARKAMAGLYSEFWDLDDNRWRSQLLKLTDAREVTLEAARVWDEKAADLAKLEREHLRQVGEGYEMMLREVAPKIGLDIKDWVIGWWPDDYQRSYGTGDRPLRQEVLDVIREQQARLKEITDAIPER